MAELSSSIKQDDDLMVHYDKKTGREINKGKDNLCGVCTKVCSSL